MYSEKEQSDITRRTDFYGSKEVAKLLLKEGAPKTKKAMLKLFGLENKDTTEESFNCIRNVTFVIHPQQINIRDKANGKIIVSIAR